MSSSRWAVLFLREIGKEALKLDPPVREYYVVHYEITIHHHQCNNLERRTLNLTNIIFKVKTKSYFIIIKIISPAR